MKKILQRWYNLRTTRAKSLTSVWFHAVPNSYQSARTWATVNLIKNHVN